MSSFVITTIDEVDKRLLRTFDCGQLNMNSFLKYHAINYHNWGEGNTKVIYNKDTKEIFAYYTLKCSAIDIEDPEMSNEPRLIPAIEISRFAVNKKYQHKGLGKIVFANIIKEITFVRKEYAAVKMITLFAIPTAAGFYKQFGFKEFDNTFNIIPISDNDGCIGMYATL